MNDNDDVSTKLMLMMKLVCPVMCYTYNNTSQYIYVHIGT